MIFIFVYIAPTILHIKSSFLLHRLISRATVWGRDSIWCLNFYLKVKLLILILFICLVFFTFWWGLLNFHEMISIGATELTNCSYGEEFLFNRSDLFRLYPPPSLEAWLHIIFFIILKFFSFFLILIHIFLILVPIYIFLLFHQNLFFFLIFVQIYIISILASKFVLFIIFAIFNWKNIKNLLLRFSLILIQNHYILFFDCYLPYPFWW